MSCSEYAHGFDGRIQRWDVDPAGNRLPGTAPADQRQQEDWVERVYRSWKDPSFNPLGEGSALTHHRGPVDRWLGNRIGHHQGSVWRYDGHGNRVEQVKSDGERQHLFYDGGQQLTGVQSVGGNNAAPNSSRYIYDALGRRLKKTITDPNGKQHITYYGWDGERLVHTECLKDDGTRDIEHTVYEPGSFTPLVRLSATTQGAPHTQPHLLVQMTQAGTPADKRDSSGNLRSLEMMQSMISAFPEHMQKEMEKSMKHMLEKGPSPTGRTIMSNMGIDPDSFVGGMREGIRQIEQEEQTRVEIHFYHCDHLGTPIALTDRNGKIVWAARYDSWGNIEEEFNPHNIEQNIRLPGQHHDRETGLHYNRHRYYDPKIGAYINQDPIGLRGGMNSYIYPKSPTGWIDPTGLATAVVDRNQGTMTVTFSNGSTRVYPAGNNTTNPTGNPNVVGSNGPAPAGTFPVQPSVNTTGQPEYGTRFWPVGDVDAQGNRLDIARQRGIGVHCGRTNHTSRTQGCIRLDNPDCDDLHNRTQNDRLTGITIR